MIGFLRRLLKDRRGNALMIAGAMLPILVGAAGLATDTIEWTLWKRQLQRAADSAAISGVYDRDAAEGATTTVESTVAHDLTLNLHTQMDLVSGYPQVTYPADTTTQTNQVHVMLAVQKALPFSSFFLTTAPTITANATAASIMAGGDPCFDATQPGSGTPLYFSGNAAIEAPDCDGFSNGSGTNVSVAKGSSDVVLRSIGGVGGIQESNNFHVTAYRPYSPPYPDPFSDVNPVAADMNCATMTVVKGGKNVTTPVALSETTDLAAAKAAGINCFSGLSVGSGTSLTVPADFGPIYINGGDAKIQGNFSCTGCSIVLTNRDTATTATIGNISANASANINMTPPLDGPFTGIAIYQDRRAVDKNGKVNLINGNSSSVIQGALYFPSQELDYNGTGNTDAQCTMFVAYRLNFSGNSATSNKFRSLAECSEFGFPSTSAYRMVRLVG